MKTKLTFIKIISIFIFQSCGIFHVKSGNKFEKKEVKSVKFCELVNYDGQLIKTKLKYSGVLEYWGASGFGNCNLNHKVELNFDEYYEGWKWLLIQRKLSKLYRKYDKKIAEMVVIGKFELAKTDTISTKDSIILIKDGFGHLGTNEAQITVKSLKIKLKKK